MQRNELLTKKQVWLRKNFGRFLFTNIFIHYFQTGNIEKKTEILFLKEIETFKNYLPSNVQNVMDVGCGLGIISLNLNKIYLNKPNFFLLDKNRIDKKIKYGFSVNYESYNDLNETKKILSENNFEDKQIHLIDVEKKIKINKKIDLVISLKSMGYHYPFEEYLQLFEKCCTKNTVFIFDISSGYYGLSLFKNFFNEVSVIYEEESIHPLKRILCKELKG